MAVTDRTRLPIRAWLYHLPSYLCDEDHHERCTGLVSPKGVVALLCGCQNPECTCTQRAMESAFGPTATTPR